MFGGGVKHGVLEVPKSEPHGRFQYDAGDCRDFEQFEQVIDMSMSRVAVDCLFEQVGNGGDGRCAEKALDLASLDQREKKCRVVREGFSVEHDVCVEQNLHRYFCSRWR